MNFIIITVNIITTKHELYHNHSQHEPQLNMDFIIIKFSMNVN